MDQEGVDAGSPRRPECVPQELMRFFEIDIAHHVEGAVQIAVADGGDDDISDSAMIDAGNLLCGLLTHVGRPWCYGADGEARSGVDRVQERGDAIEDGVRRLHRHIVPRADFVVAGAGDGAGYGLRELRRARAIKTAADHEHRTA